MTARSPLPENTPRDPVAERVVDIILAWSDVEMSDVAPLVVDLMREVVAPLRKQVADLSNPRPTHRHVQRGTTYRALGEAEAQVSAGDYRSYTLGAERTARLLREGDRLVIYQEEGGKLWARFPDEFEDGRFERLPVGAAS